MLATYANRIQTVTELTLSIKGVLESGFAFVTVIGEISNLKIPYSGHLYFTLKDHKSQLKAVMFKTQLRYLNIKPVDGLEVLCRGRISVYDARGEYQLLVDTLDAKGAGALQLAFEKLKIQLAAAGLFEAAHKQALPLLPDRVALITAPRGAAVFDFLNVARSRFPGIPLEILPVRVQGTEAADDIVSALQLLNQRKSSDVIVLCRGGGSIEDLWPFNEEKVARAIYASQIPVVSAIGHEIDFTIADFVADLRAPTPTAAGQIVIPDRTTLSNRVKDLTRRISQNIDKKLATNRYRLLQITQKLGDPSSSLAQHLLRLDQTMSALLHALIYRRHYYQLRLQNTCSRLALLNPAHQLINQQQKNNELFHKLILLLNHQINRKKSRLQKAIALLEVVSPLSILARGYSITRSQATGKIIYTSNEIEMGETIDIRLQKGHLTCCVTDKKE